ncbi:hypothetical protein [Priestia megaterium]|uniref:hypothetical protein n=1 Tax=Priestia megaterium TaxID=1404 RepID=UPI00207A76AE|nr:hypothetical protein [Priestia megaterium]USL44419.1 hypothetical protein LIS78_10320 [Priestia megaterium]
MSFIYENTPELNSASVLPEEFKLIVELFERDSNGTLDTVYIESDKLFLAGGSD